MRKPEIFLKPVRHIKKKGCEDMNGTGDQMDGQRPKRNAYMAEYMRKYREKHPEYYKKELAQQTQYQKKRRKTDSAYRQKRNASANEYIKAHRKQATETQKKWLASEKGRAYTEAYKARRRELAAIRRAKLKAAKQNDQTQTN